MSDLTVDTITHALLAGDRVMLGRAFTLAESARREDRLLTEQVLQNLLPHTGRSIRIGITGVPGVGKSTFIEALGDYLIDQGKKLAVLAVDPSSPKTKGSILGDKTRMEKLSRNPGAFIRPSPSGLSLGGVTSATRECVLLAEAAGFDVIIIETVGVGQSETAVRDMVDFFLLLMLAGSGDELQGIKKGIMELADGVAITKADGDNLKRAQQAQSDFQHALHLFPAADSQWTTPVWLTSAVQGLGITETWLMVERYVEHTQANGYLTYVREKQKILWLHEHLERLIVQAAMETRSGKSMAHIEQEVKAGRVLPSAAARQLFESLGRDSTG